MSDETNALRVTPERPTFRQVLDEIWEAGGKAWDDLPDPEAFLRWMRGDTPHVMLGHPCPCTFGCDVPCHPSCSCVSRASSHGCRRCSIYGSAEQRKRMASMLGYSADAIFALAAHTGRDPADLARWAAEGGLVRMHANAVAACSAIAGWCLCTRCQIAKLPAAKEADRA